MQARSVPLAVFNPCRTPHSVSERSGTQGVSRAHRRFRLLSFEDGLGGQGELGQTDVAVARSPRPTQMCTTAGRPAWPGPTVDAPVSPEPTLSTRRHFYTSRDSRAGATGGGGTLREAWKRSCSAMVRIVTFVGLCAATLVGVKALDNLVIWMAERREANIDNFKLDREANALRQKLVKDLQEKQAMTSHEVVEKHHVHLEKDFKRVYEHLKPQTQTEKHTLPSYYQRQESPKPAPSKDQDPQENDRLLRRLNSPRKPLRQAHENLVVSETEECPGGVIAECLACGETFELDQPIPHSPLFPGV